MKNKTAGQLWDRLSAAGLVTGKFAPPADQHSPWFVRVMLGFAGWLGALFLLGFIGASLEFVFKSKVASLVTGAAVCAAAAVIFRSWREKDFAVQFGLATSFAGQALFISGIMRVFSWESGNGYLAVALFEALLAVVISNSIHRVVSASASAVSLSLALSSYGAQHIAPALITSGIAALWLSELKWADRGSFVRPIGYGLVLAAISLNGAMLMHGLIWPGGKAGINPDLITVFYWAGVVLNGGVFIFSVSRLLTREGLVLHDRPAQVALLAALAISFASCKAPGVITGLIIVLLGYANGNRVLAGLGIFALLAYLSHYYYQMEATLLVKSLSLAATGAVLLVSRFALGRLPPDEEHGGDRHA